MSGRFVSQCSGVLGGGNAMRFCLVVCLTLALAPLSAQENWSRFRGENGFGVSLQPGIPTSWEESEIAWKVQLEHVGHSSPVIWGKTLLITTATEGGGKRFLHSFNADTGEQNWVAAVTMSDSPKHQKNSWASSTPVTDGEVICMMMADAESQRVGAWDFAGRELWIRDLGTFESQHGLGVSPVLHDGVLLVPNDQRGPSTLEAMDSRTGKSIWVSERLPGNTSYSTPALVDDGRGGLQVICISQSSGVAGLDFRTGKQLWRTPELPMRSVASPVVVNGLTFVTCGSGGNGKYLAAVRTSATVNDSERIVFERRTTLPYVPCLIADKGLLYLWGDKGIIVCLRQETGEEVWMKRIDGAFSGSPILIEDRIYCASEEGEMVVLRTGEEFEELGRTPLGDFCHSTPSVGNGHLYVHTFNSLIAVKAK